FDYFSTNTMYQYIRSAYGRIVLFSALTCEYTLYRIFIQFIVLNKMFNKHGHFFVKFFKHILITVGLYLVSTSDNLQFWEVFFKQVNISVLKPEQLDWAYLCNFNNQFIQKLKNLIEVV